MHKKIITVYLLYILVFLLGTTVLYLWFGNYYVYLILIPLGIIGWYQRRLIKDNPDDYKKAEVILNSPQALLW